MTCADLEILLCDYVDGTLHGEQKSAVEKHLADCRSCAEFAADAGAAVAFVGRVADVVPPQELMTRIVFAAQTIREKEYKRSPVRRWASGWLEPVFQPRFAMGMAMAVLSFAMMGKFAGIEVRQLKPSDLNPIAVYASAEDRAVKTWGRAVKYYENLRFVYEIQTRLAEWRQESEEERARLTPGNAPAEVKKP